MVILAYHYNLIKLLKRNLKTIHQFLVSVGMETIDINNLCGQIKLPHFISEISAIKRIMSNIQSKLNKKNILLNEYK